MNEPQPEAKSPTRDHLLIVFAGVFAHPSTLSQVAEVIDDTIVGKDDAVTITLWSYLQANADAPSLVDAAVDLVSAGVGDVVSVLDRLVAESEKLTPARVVGNARKLARVVVNARRRETIKRDLDAQPLAALDVEAVTSNATHRYPHTTPGIHVLTPDDCAAAVEETHRVIPTGFSYFDQRFRGWLVGEQHLLPARTGDGKSTFSYACVRNQFFANAARHRDDPWWTTYGPDWQQHDSGGRRRELLRPLNAGHADPDETHEAPRVLWFSLEEPVAQVLGRFYCDLLSLDRQSWMTNARFRTNTQQTYATEIAHINDVLGSGRLTVVDYATRRAGADGSGIDTELVRQTLADITKKWRAWARDCERRDKAEGTERPRMVLVDYGQLVQIPETDDRFAVLDEVSVALRRLAPETASALLTPLMLLRGHESIEPSKEEIKGSSQFAQDAARILTLWPFGKRERQALREAVDGGQQSAAPTTPFDDDDGGIEIPYDNDEPVGEGVLDPMLIHCRRAQHELRLSCDKDRFGDASWQLPLTFDGRFARVTEALPDIDDETGDVWCDREGRPRWTSYRRHDGVMSIVRAAVKVGGSKRKRD